MLEALPQPTQAGQTRAVGIDLNKLRMRRAPTAVLALSTAPVGFTASDLARKAAFSNTPKRPSSWTGGGSRPRDKCLGEAVEHTEALAQGTDFYMAWHNLAWARLERAEVYRRLGSGNVCTEYRRAAEAYRRLAVYRKEYCATKLSEVKAKLAACAAN